MPNDSLEKAKVAAKPEKVPCAEEGYVEQPAHAEAEPLPVLNNFTTPPVKK